MYFFAFSKHAGKAFCYLFKFYHKYRVLTIHSFLYKEAISFVRKKLKFVESDASVITTKGIGYSMEKNNDRKGTEK